MAENKKSFVLYADLMQNIEHLTNEEKGVLFNHLLMYVNDLNPTLEDRLLVTAWKPIEAQLKRDLKKFEQVKAKRSEAGKKSAKLKKQQNSTNSTSVESVKQKATNSTSVKSVQHRSTNSTDNVNDNVNDNVINIYRAFAHLCLSEDEFKKLNADYSKEVIDEVLDEIENYKQNKKYKSLFLTAKNWLKKRKVETKPPTDWIDNFEEIFKL